MSQKNLILITVGAFVVMAITVFAFAPLLAHYNPSPDRSRVKDNTLNKTTDTANSDPVYAVQGNQDRGGYFVQLSGVDQMSELPVGSVTLHKVEDAKAGAVLIPQNHKYPGSDTDDPRNDSAEVTQKEIYQILEKLHNKYGLDLVVNEGELKGPVPEGKGKVQKVEKLLQAKEKIASNVQKLKKAANQGKISESAFEQVSSRSRKVLDRIDRRIALTGAPYILAAKKDEVDIYGAENQATRQKCKKIVRDYIYQKDALAGSQAGSGLTGVPAGAAELKDKLKKLKGSQGSGQELLGGQSADFSALSLLDTLRKLRQGGATPDLKGRSSALARLLGGSSNARTELINDLKRIKAAAKAHDKNHVRQAVGNMIEALEDLSEIADSAGQDKNGRQDSAPSRSDNPYDHINNPEKLKSLMEKTEDQINKYVKDRRNKEAAQYFVNALEKENKKVGVIQFGAGHEKGLVEELNQRGVSVMVIKSDEVLRREQVQEAQNEPLKS